MYTCGQPRCCSFALQPGSKSKRIIERLIRELSSSKILVEKNACREQLYSAKEIYMLHMAFLKIGPLRTIIGTAQAVLAVPNAARLRLV